MHYFLDPTFDPITGILNEEESRHAIKALRISVGDSIEIGNGRGNRYQCAVRIIGKNQVILAVESKIEIPAPQFRFSVALAPTKNASRFEWFLEKATEMGVDDIIALESKRTERSRLNDGRLERIIISAAKQSQRSFLPVFHGSVPFSKITTESKNIRFIAHCDTNFARIALHEARPAEPENVLILIGPEGDFTPGEIEAAYAAGFQGISLGSNRLRTETAGVYCAAIASTWR